MQKVAILTVLFFVLTPSPAIPESAFRIGYSIDTRLPHTHLFHIGLTVKNIKNPYLDLAMPAWIPGYNRNRNFARNVQEVIATDSRGYKLEVTKLDFQTWRVTRGEDPDIKLAYKVYANDLEDINISSHVDETHAFFNGAAVFMYVVGAKDEPVSLKILKPEEWKIATGLKSTSQADVFTADSYDQLIDCPTEIGNFTRYEFMVEGKRHSLVFYGLEEFDASFLIEDFSKFIRTCALLFGTLPYSQYMFIYHLTSRERRSGVEHGNSTAIIFNKQDFLARKKYDEFISVSAHEYFHLWNIKRIKPEGWGPFNYTKVAQTKSHWFTEGVTSYYTSLILVRSGVWDQTMFLKDMAAKIEEFENKPGKKMMSLEEASWDVVLRADNRRDTTVSYYIKGALVAFMLDCEIRKRTNGQKSLDDVLVFLDDNYAKKNRAYKNQDLLQIIGRISGSDFSDYYKDYIAGTEEIPYQEFLRTLGLKLRIEEDASKPWLGIESKESPGNCLQIEYVRPGSPAYESGIDAGDILLALNRRRITFDNWDDLLRQCRPGENIHISLFHRDRLLEKTVPLGKKRDIHYKIQEIDNVTPFQLQMRQSLFWKK
jgi:predicted metalloprotease with PDZ domain